jgi:hypothetical protein
MINLYKDHAPDPEWLAEADQLYVAIGEFIVVFSTVVMEMRRFLQGAIARKGTREYRLMNATFEGMTANPIKAAFLTVCSQIRDLDENDQKVRKALDISVSRLMRRRNQIAHADWLVGEYLRKPASGTVAVKIRSSNEFLDIEHLDLNADLVKRLGEQASEVRKQVVVFGNSCALLTNPSPSQIYEVAGEGDERHLVRRDGGRE